MKLSIIKHYLLIAGMSAWPVIGQSDNLLDLVRLAQTRDAVFAAAEANWKATQEKYPQAKADLLPSVELFANASKNKSDTELQGTSTLAAGKQNYDSTSIGLSLRQPLYNEERWINYDQAKLQLTQANSLLTLAKQELILRVSQSYFDVLAAKDTVTLLDAQFVSATEQLRQASKKMELGDSTITDVHEAQARHDLIHAQIIAANNELQLKQRALTQILNIPPPALQPLSDSWRPQALQLGEMTQWIERAKQASPQILIKQLDVQIAKKEIDRKSAIYGPTLDLVMSHQNDSADDSPTFGTATDTTSSIIGVQLNVPIYLGNRSSSFKREAIHKARAAQDEQENASRTAEFNVSQSFLSIVNGIAQIDALKQAIVSSKSSLKASQRGWELGTRTTVDVLNAQQQLYSAKRDLQLARYDALLNQLKLYAAVGDLGENILIKTMQYPLQNAMLTQPSMRNE